MSRPKLTERLTLRLPEDLLRDLAATAERRGVSLNEVALCCFENELSRIGTYRLDYYAQLRPVLEQSQGDIVVQRPTLSDTMVSRQEIKKVV